MRLRFSRSVPLRVLYSLYFCISSFLRRSMSCWMPKYLSSMASLSIFWRRLLMSDSNCSSVCLAANNSCSNNTTYYFSWLNSNFRCSICCREKVSVVCRSLFYALRRYIVTMFLHLGHFDGSGVEGEEMCCGMINLHNCYFKPTISCWSLLFYSFKCSFSDYNPNQSLRLWSVCSPASSFPVNPYRKILEVGRH